MNFQTSGTSLATSGFGQPWRKTRRRDFSNFNVLARCMLVTVTAINILALTAKSDEASVDVLDKLNDGLVSLRVVTVAASPNSTSEEPSTLVQYLPLRPVVVQRDGTNLPWFPDTLDLGNDMLLVQGSVQLVSEPDEVTKLISRSKKVFGDATEVRQVVVHRYRAKLKSGEKLLWSRPYSDDDLGLMTVSTTASAADLKMAWQLELDLQWIETIQPLALQYELNVDQLYEALEVNSSDEKPLTWSTLRRRMLGFIDSKVVSKNGSGSQRSLSLGERITLLRLLEEKFVDAPKSDDSSDSLRSKPLQIRSRSELLSTSTELKIEKISNVTVFDSISVPMDPK
jgi:hypothetical protein